MKATKVKLSLLRSPEGALRLIESATLQLGNGIAPSTWLDCSFVDHLLKKHPITVRQVQKHYEVVGGFRSFHLISSVCSGERALVVQVGEESASDCICFALFELISDSLMFPLDTVASRSKLYRVLKDLRSQLSKDHRINTPSVISPRALKELLGLSSNQTKIEGARHSELSRLIQRSRDGLVP